MTANGTWSTNTIDLEEVYFSALKFEVERQQEAQLVYNHQVFLKRGCSFLLRRSLKKGVRNSQLLMMLQHSAELRDTLETHAP